MGMSADELANMSIKSADLDMKMSKIKQVTPDNFIIILDRIYELFDEGDYATKLDWCNDLNYMLESMLEDDFFGSDGINDPRGEYKQGIISHTEELSKENGKNFFEVITLLNKFGYFLFIVSFVYFTYFNQEILSFMFK